MLEGASIVVFADDWGAHPSSAQHLLRRFLKGNRVIWVNTVGLRWPRPTRRDLSKILGKLRHWSGRKPVSDGRPRPELHDLPLVPLTLGGAARWINAHIMRRAVRSWIGTTTSPSYIVTTLPLTADLVGAVPAATFVYYLVDDYASWPGLGGAVVKQLDQEQARGADLIVAASQALALAHSSQARGRMVYLPHGVDVEHFGEARAVREKCRQADEQPLADVIFFGAFDERIDGKLLEAVVASRPALRFLFVGPTPSNSLPHPQGAHVEWRGAVPYEELPALLGRCRVTILPYVGGDFGGRLSPLKAREALAAGLPVVATDVPELRTLPRGVFLGQTAEELAKAIDQALISAADVPTLEELQADSWEARAERFSSLLQAAQAGRVVA